MTFPPRSTLATSLMGNMRTKVPQTPAHSQMEEVELATLLKRQKDTEYFYSVFKDIICHFLLLSG